MALPFATAGSVERLLSDTRSKQQPFAVIQLVSGEAEHSSDDGKLKFSIKVLDGTVMAGDEVQIAVYKKWKRNENDRKRYKLKNIFSIVITNDMLNAPLYKQKKLLEIDVPLIGYEGYALAKKLIRSYAPERERRTNKIIRLGRRLYSENRSQSDSIFSNYIRCDICGRVDKDTEEALGVSILLS